MYTFILFVLVDANTKVYRQQPQVTLVVKSMFKRSQKSIHMSPMLLQ